LPLPRVQPTLGAKNGEQTLRTSHTEPPALELCTTTTSTTKQRTGLYYVSIGNYSQYYTPLTTPHLWDNSTILPTWHEQQRSILTAVKLALECVFCFGDPAVKAALVDPMADNVKAHRFYQKLGFQPQGERMFGPDKCLVDNTASS
jgi:Acetyltransferase (GNAT) domain